MPKVSTNISLDPELKAQGIALYKDLGMDLSTAVSIFLKQSLRANGLPFKLTRDVPNKETIEAMNEYYEMKEHPENYKKYSSFKELLEDLD